MVLDASGGFASPRIYQFDIRGPKIQPLGFVALPGDEEAVALAERIIEGLSAPDAAQYLGCTLEIAEDRRCVARIAFEVPEWKAPFARSLY